MTIITGTTSSGLYSYASNDLSDQLGTSVSSADGEDTGSDTVTGDSVTLSSEIETARKREYLGLTATGRLSMTDLESAAAAQETDVSQMLSSTMAELGIDADQKITLSLDADDNIVVTEDFEGKSELEDALNGDDAFVKAFSGLSANNEVVDYVNSLLENTQNLFDYMGTGTEDADLMALATRFSEIKSGGSSMETLWNLGRSETPYTYTYDGTA